MMTVEMHIKSLKELDFDAAVQLARSDPEAFEQLRQDAIEALIARAPERNRQQLRCLQWRIDQERERAPNPTAACVRLYQMMWDSFAGDRGLIDVLYNSHKARRKLNEHRPKAAVLTLSGTAPAGTPSES